MVAVIAINGIILAPGDLSYYSTFLSHHLTPYIYINLFSCLLVFLILTPSLQFYNATKLIFLKYCFPYFIPQFKVF